MDLLLTKSGVMGFVNDPRYRLEDREYLMRNGVGARIEKVFFRKNAVGESSYEIRSATVLYVRTNCNISPGDELFIEYGK